jgi:hypothetical protein
MLIYILLYFFQVGGVDLIEDIAKGKVEIIDYDYFLAHEDIAAGTRRYVINYIPCFAQSSVVDP